MDSIARLQESEARLRSVERQVVIRFVVRMQSNLSSGQIWSTPTAQAGRDSSQASGGAGPPEKETDRDTDSAERVGDEDVQHGGKTKGQCQDISHY